MIKNKLKSSGQTIILATGENYILKDDEVQINGNLFKKKDLEINLQNIHKNNPAKSVKIAILKRDGVLEVPCDLVYFDEWEIDNVVQSSLTECVDNINTLIYSTDNTSAVIDSRVIVKEASDLSGVLDSTKLYVIDGVIDLGVLEIIVPETGLFITGLDYFVSGLKSTVDGHIMFKNDVGAYSGNLKISNLFMTSSGVGSKLFDLDNQENFGAIEFQSVNIGDFSDSTTSIGEIANYRQFRTNDCGFFRNQDGLTFTGVWAGGFRINDTIALSQAVNSTLFKAGVGLTFAGRCISDINASSVSSTAVVFDFVENNFLLDGGFQLNGASFSPNSTISVTSSETSIKSFFRDCVGIKNTRAGFEMVWIADENNVLTVNTPQKSLGTTNSTHNTWFTQTNNNEMTYNSTLIKDFKISAPLTVDGGANDDINIYLKRWDDSASSYEDIKVKTRKVSNVQGAIDVAYFNIIAVVNDLDLNDRIEVWIENITDGTNAKIETGSEVIAEVL